MQVLYVAKKYILPSLGDECVRFLQENLNTENVFCVLSHGQQYDEKFLVDQCWKMIDRETSGVMKSEEFVTIDRCIKRDTLTIREADLFKAVDLWASKKCERQGLTADGNLKRKILGEKIIKEIRFPVMEERDFASVVLASEILTSEEVISMMKYFNSVASSAAGFLENRRVGTLLSCCRFGQLGEDYVWAYFNASIYTECIALQVDKDVLLYGVRMFGSENGDYLAILRIISSEDQSVILGKSGKFSSERMQHAHSPSISYYGFDILFDSPVVLNKGIKYSVKAIIDGPDSFYGIDCHHSVQSHGVKFSFSKGVGEVEYDDDILCTDANCGQFAEFLFRPKLVDKNI